jgi:hypothetical protein
MPGVAYTIPAGDHLDVEVATSSLMHATGRTPAVVDVAVRGEVPVLVTSEHEDGGDAAPDAPGRAGVAPKGPPADRPGRDGGGEAPRGQEPRADAPRGYDDARVLAAASDRQLPATGGGAALLGLAALAGAGALRRR